MDHKFLENLEIALVVIKDLLELKFRIIQLLREEMENEISNGPSVQSDPVSGDPPFIV